jgi:hypothetical protein
MNIQFNLPSSNPNLLENASRIALETAKRYITEDVIGIVFLGAIARGYFDRSTDIDFAIFARKGSQFTLAQKFIQVEGLEVQFWWSEYETALYDQRGLDLFFITWCSGLMTNWCRI